MTLCLRVRKQPWRYAISLYTNVKQLRLRVCIVSVHPTRPRAFDRCSPIKGSGQAPIPLSIVFPSSKSNGTPVPIDLVLLAAVNIGYTSVSYTVRKIKTLLQRSLFPKSSARLPLPIARIAFAFALERLDTLTSDSIALGITITPSRRSSVAERGSHNP